jgi:hypothetical protein
MKQKPHGIKVRKIKGGNPAWGPTRPQFDKGEMRYREVDIDPGLYKMLMVLEEKK